MKTHPRYKTLFALLLALLMLLSLTGCIGMTQLIAPTPTPTATPTATPSPTPTATPEPTAEPTPVHKIYPITFGLSNEVPYQNEFFNLSIDLDDLWFAETMKRLDQYNDFLPDMTNQQRVEQYLKRLKKREDVYDYFAHTDTGLLTIQIRIKNYSMLQGVYSVINSYLNAFYEFLLDNSQGGDIQLLQSAPGTVEIAGEKRPCWRFSIERDGVVEYNAFALFLKGNYVMNIFVSSSLTDHVDEMLTLIHPLS